MPSGRPSSINGPSASSANSIATWSSKPPTSPIVACGGPLPACSSQHSAVLRLGSLRLHQLRLESGKRLAHHGSSEPEHRSGVHAWPLAESFCRTAISRAVRSRVRASLPFPQYSPNTLTNTNISPAGAPLGNTWYDSLQINVTQRFSHGLSASGNYTYSKNLDLMSATDIFNRQNGKTFSANDLPHQIRMTAEYQVPSLKNSSMQDVVEQGRLLRPRRLGHRLVHSVSKRCCSRRGRTPPVRCRSATSWDGSRSGKRPTQDGPGHGPIDESVLGGLDRLRRRAPHRSDRYQLPLLRSDQEHPLESQRLDERA